METLSTQHGIPERDLRTSSTATGEVTGKEAQIGSRKLKESKKSSLVQEAGSRAPGLPSVAWISTPRLPQMTLEPDIAQLIVADEIGKSQDQQLRTLLSNLKSSSEHLDDVNKKKMDKMHERMKKVLEQIEKQKEAKRANDISFGLGMASSILALIGAAFLTFVTMGAAAPALIGAAVAATTTIMDGIDRGLKEAGVTFESGPLKGRPATASLAGLISAASEAALISDPAFRKLTEEEQQKRIAGMQMAVTVGISIMLLGVGIGSAAVGLSKIASEGVKAATTLSATINRAIGSLIGKGAELAQLAADTANSGSTISSSVFGSQLAFITFESNELDNQRQYFEALAEAVQRLISLNQNSLEMIQQSIGTFIQEISQSNDQFYEVRRNIIVNA